MIDLPFFVMTFRAVYQRMGVREADVFPFHLLSLGKYPKAEMKAE